MKIVFITSAFYPSIGGVETHVLELSKELIKRGHSVTVITENKQLSGESDNEAGELKSIDESIYFTLKKLYQINIYYFKFGQASFYKKFRIWWLMFKNRHLFLDADIIHCHDVFIWYLPLRLFYFQKKIFTTFHGYETKFPPEKKAIFIRKVSEKLSYGNICIGNFISKWYGTKPDYVLYGGVSKAKTYKNIPRSLKILLIGRLEKDIGIQIYKETLRKLQGKHIKFDLTVCGDGTLRHELESYGKVLGAVKDIKSYIQKSSIVFASSYLTILDVIQAGRPLFAVYTNPLKHDYLRDTPFAKYITISGSSDDLFLRLSKFRPNMAKIEQGVKWANAQTWGTVADTYIQLWSKK